MKKKNLLFILLSLFCLAIFLLSGCSTKENKSANAADNEIKNKEDDFKKGIYELRNPKTQNTMIVNGEGKVILRNIDPGTEYLGTIRDYRTDKVSFIYKIISGESVNTYEYKYMVDGKEESYTEEYPSQRTIYYTTSGEPLGFETNTYSAFRSLNDYLILPYDGYRNKGVKRNVYDVRNKKYVDLPYNMVEFYGDHLLSSTEMYNDDDTVKCIAVLNDNLETVKTIDDYSIVTINNFGGTDVLKVCKKVYKENAKMDSDSDLDKYDFFYNFLDTDFNLMFDESVNTDSYENKTSVVTLHTKDKEFDYDFKLKKVVSNERPYVKKMNDYEKKEIERSKYENISNQIKEIDKKYQYVSTHISSGKVIFQANYKNTKNEEEWRDCSDIYDVNKNLLKSFDFVNFVDEDGGRIFADYCECYDFDMNLLKKFDEKSCIDKYEFGGKILYSDLNDENYKRKKSGNIYDVNLNTIFTDVMNVDSYVVKDSIVIIDKNGTTIYDKDFNPTTTFDRKIELRNWYTQINHMAFLDYETNLKGIMTNDYKIEVDNLKEVDNLQKNFFTFQKGFKYGFMDYKGNVLLSFSIFDSMDEDTKNKEFEGDME